MSLDAISWKVFTSPNNNLTYGSFRLAVGDQFICIHTLDESEVPNADKLYVAKLTQIIEAIATFRAVLGTKNIASLMEWTNPPGSGATGCVAFHHDIVSINSMVFFEISACASTVRIPVYTFRPKAFKSVDTFLATIAKELTSHREAMLNWMESLERESVNKA